MLRAFLAPEECNAYATWHEGGGEGEEKMGEEEHGERKGKRKTKRKRSWKMWNTKRK